MTDLPAPSFNKADNELVGLASRDVRAHRAVGEFLQLTTDERDRSLNFQPTDVGAGEDIAGLSNGDGHLGESENPRREIVTDITLDAASACRRADHSQRPADFGGN